jgi:predicted AAA+ superfamily ATPase
MDEIDFSHRLIGIKGSRGVGKTTFLLQYAKQHFDIDDKACLYINLNNFYFTKRSLIDFADEFRKKGGKTLLIDQVFKYADWSKALRYCYDNFQDLNIIFTGSSVMRLKEENSDLAGCVHSYNLRGFSFREYLNLINETNLPAYSLNDILTRHEEIAADIVAKVKPIAYFQDYLHHGFYPFFLEKRNFSENLLKTMNMVLEVDVLLLKQVELKYLPKIKKLFYLLATNAINTPCSPNVSQLSSEIEISRATVMNYIKYMKDARLMNLLYSKNEDFPKKPEKVYLQNTNQMYAIWPTNIEHNALMETFFFNNVYKEHSVNKGEKGADFLVNKKLNFCVCNKNDKRKTAPDVYYAVDMIEIGEQNYIPLWLFGFLY